MILDMKDLPDGHVLSSELCIIGAGAAGITLAMDLANSGMDVLLLESGGMRSEKNTQALYEGDVADLRLHSPPDRYRQRRFGGTTTIWGGRCMPFDAIDFEHRDFMPNSGWPIDRAALAPFYPHANRICEAGDFAYTVGETFTRPLRPMIEGFTGVNFTTDTLERFSCPTDFGARYGRELRAAPNIRVLLHANVTALRLNSEGNHVDSVVARTLTGRTTTVRAQQFVLAAGGLEVARLLLASRDVQSAGIGNQNDMVGRYYMCHLAGTVGALSINRPLGAVWNGYDVSDDGIYCRRRIALTPSAQHQNGIGNFIARLHHPRITDPNHGNAILSLLYLVKNVIPYEYRKRLHGGERTTVAMWLKHVRNVVSGPFDAFGFAWHMLKDRKLANRKFPSIIIKPKTNLYSLDFHAEQQPNPASRITVDREFDALGVPRIHIDWRYTPLDLHTVSRSIQMLAQELRAGGLGELVYDPATLESEMTRYGAYGGHHIGTARMGNDPRTSVVDANCRVHGVENLHIASAAVFPTSSQANPTLTVVAFSLRLAQRMKVLIQASS
ncbi:MAG TPA: GMC family oxidoreductase [Steroidobacteraceae bacterium]|nr:GMC family oxidoreductase [Steroidobacteraceae bacterium]